MIDIRNALKLLDVVYVNQSESKKQYWAQKKNGT